MHYQIDLISEREITKILKLVSELHKHHGVKTEKDVELEEMLKKVDTSYIEKRLAEQLLNSRVPVLKEVAKEILRMPEKFITSVEKGVQNHNLVKKIVK